MRERIRELEALNEELASDVARLQDRLPMLLADYRHVAAIADGVLDSIHFGADVEKWERRLQELGIGVGE